MRYSIRDSWERLVACGGALLILVMASGLGAVLHPWHVSAETATNTSVADTYINSGSKNTNYGSVTLLKANGYANRSLLRFDTSAVTAGSTVTSVQLRLYSINSASTGGVRVHPSSSTWDENAVTWNTRPSWDDSILATGGATVKNKWFTIDLPISSITPNGNTSFGLDYSVKGTVSIFSSRESGSQAPQLIVGYTTVSPQQIPTTVTGAPSDIASSSATLAGNVTNNGADTTCVFAYGNSTSYGSQSATVTIPAGTGSTAVSQQITGLTPNTAYDYRLECTNSGGTAYGDNATFVTLGATPTVTTAAATNVSSTAATLGGTVTRSGADATCMFDYGLATDYGTQTTPQTVTADNAVEISADISGLTDGTTYNYRLECTNAYGTSYGDNALFTASDVVVPPGPTITKVLWVMEENTAESQLMSDPDLPYFQQLANTYGLAANMHNETKPSMPNYIAAISGDTYGLSDDASPGSHPLHGQTLFGQLPAGQAMSFAESMPANCYTKNGPAEDTNMGGSYAVRHTGWPYFVDASERSLCNQYQVNLQSNLQTAVDGGLPAFTLVAPALCNDFHKGQLSGVSDGCNYNAATGSNLRSRANWWLQTWLPKIMAGPDYQAGHLAIFIVWDEGSGSGSTNGMDCTTSTLEACHPPFIAISPYTHNVVSNTQYTHYDVLRTTEELLGIQTYLGHAAEATSFAGEFGLN